MRLKIAPYIFLLVFSTLIYSSCEDIIDVDLNDAAPRLVIEGNISNKTDTQGVWISTSAAIGSLNVFPGVSGATVAVTDNRGAEFIFRERAPGIYSSRRLRGQPGTTYTLKVTYNGNIYSATSTMPQAVSIDSLGFNTTKVFNNERKSIQLLFRDPAGVKNYYRFVLSVNGIKSNSIFVFDDDFNDGNKVTRELFDFDVDLESGDKANIEMQCIDQPVFKYWEGLSQNRNRGGASTTPANPVSNISNGALGYFSARTEQKEIVSIP